MRAADPFRVSRSPGREQYRRRIERGYRGVGRSSGDSAVVRPGNGRGAEYPGFTGESCLLEPRQKGGLDQQVTRPGLLEHAVEGGTTQCCVQRHHDRSEPTTAEQQVDHLDAVGAHRGHRVTPTDPMSGQRLGRRCGSLDEFAIGHLHVPGPDGEMIAPLGGTLDEQGRNRHRRREEQRIRFVRHGCHLLSANVRWRTVTVRRPRGRRPSLHASSAEQTRCRRAETPEPPCRSRRRRGAE